MLPKKKRVTKELFLDIIKKGGTLSSPLFVFRYIPQTQVAYAFVAPKSVAKGATERNRLRRLGYNALRSENLKPCAGIFFYKKDAKIATSKEIKEDIVKILAKLKS